MIVPCYNAAPFVAETLASVLAQTLSDWEMIVVNDGSSDDSVGRIQPFLSDPRIRLIHQSNQGVCAARNMGLAESRAPYVVFLDADDLLTPDALHQKHSALEQYPDAACVLAGYQSFDSTTGQSYPPTLPEKEYTLPFRLLDFATPGMQLPSGILYRTHLVRELGGWDTRLATSADLDLLLRVSVLFPVVELPVVHVRYRQHPNQMHRNIARMEAEMRYVMRKARKNNWYLTLTYYRWCRAALTLTIGLSYLKANQKILHGLICVAESLVFSASVFLNRFRKAPLKPPRPITSIYPSGYFESVP